MDRSNLKIYLALAFALVVLLLLFFIVAFIRQKRQSNNPTNQVPSPTSIQASPNSSPTEKLIPPFIHPTGFTGVKEEELPPDLKTLSEQKQALKREVPVNKELFTIDFNYAEDKFTVALKEPKDQARISFTDWLKTNYPALPLDRFIIN